MQRREFLKFAGFFSLSITGGIYFSGCASSNKRAATGELAFLHGVASGDPRESSVTLWTRVTPLEDDAGYVEIRVQFAGDESFDSLLVDTTVRIDENSDYTLRFLISELSNDAIYYYRFIANERVTSMIGRTWTAPKSDSNASINFASVNCQNREHGFYSAYALMLREDLQNAREDQIRFVLHLGDFIYETRNDALQYPVDEFGNRVSALIDSEGNERVISSFSQGDVLSDGSEFAVSLNDYRHLYKTYLLDPELQAARARWPFVYVWDDHEFTDDYWQTEANYDDTGNDSTINEPSQIRKVAANQAWYEYMPVDYSVDPVLGDVSHYARPFQSTHVGTSLNEEFDEDGLAMNVNNLAAINSLVIYRSLRFGKNLQLVLTDLRSFRSDHAVPEDISGNFQGFVHSRSALPLSLVNILDAGREANNGHPPEILDLPPIRNPRVNSAPGTMLGKQQKQWWKEVLINSKAKWKVWGNSVPLMRMGIDVSSLNIGIEDIILSSDAWDGYNSERRELMNYLHENNINNVVSIAGDVHAFFAGKVLNDYDVSTVQISYSIPEFVCGAISSISQFTALDHLSIRTNPTDTEKILRNLIIYNDAHSNQPICNLNTTLLRGVEASLQVAQLADSSIPVVETVAPMNPHLKYVDTSSHGYSLIVVEAEKVSVDFVMVDSISVDPRQKIPQELRRIRFEVLTQNDENEVELQGPFITGVPPYPFN